MAEPNICERSIGVRRTGCSRALLSIVAGLVSAGCQDRGATGGSADAAAVDVSGDAATVPNPARICGATACRVSMEQRARGLRPCCRGDECGWSSSLIPEPHCYEPRRRRGGVDLSCPDIELPGSVIWRGCCTTGGTCGGLDLHTGLGCVAQAQLPLANPPAGGAAPRRCTYDAQATCEALVEVVCDGPEDCPGQVCCGRSRSKPQVSSIQYDRFVCLDSCAGAADPSGNYFEMCHPGARCSNPAHRCLGSYFLPDFLHRCFDSGPQPSSDAGSGGGEVRCGEHACQVGHKCCLASNGIAREGRTQWQSHCVAKDVACACRPTATVSDGGGVADAAAADAATAPDAGVDAAIDAATQAGADAEIDAQLDAATGAGSDASSDGAPTQGQ